MKKVLIAGLAITFSCAIGLGQAPTPNETKKVELRSPWIPTGGRTLSFDKENRGKNCLDLVRMVNACNGKHSLAYGDRIGNNWDIFQLNSSEQQTRMIDLGKHELDDKIDVPWIRPWAKLRPGEQRHISIDVRGADGAPGRNGDGTYSLERKPRNKGNADAPLDRQVTGTVRTESGEFADGFLPVMLVKLGHVYAIRMFDSSTDQYLLFRVDALETGVRTTISIKLISVPTKAVF